MQTWLPAEYGASLPRPHTPTRPQVRAFDLSFATRLLDLGGATGALAAAACAAYPSLEEAVVVDLPHVLELAQRHFAPTAAPREPAAPAEVQGAGGGGGGGFGGGGDGGGSGGGGSGDCGCNGRLRWLAADFFTETDKLPQQVRDRERWVGG